MSTSGVPNQTPSEGYVSDERTSKNSIVWELGNFTYLGGGETWCLYGGVWLTKIS